MKRLIFYFVLVVFLFSLAACSVKTDITGVWEQEMETSILGIEETSTAQSVCRFTFLKDGTGIQEHEIIAESYPNAVREFIWNMEGDMLTLDYGEGHTEEFAAVLNKGSLKLENRRGSYDLKKK